MNLVHDVIFSSLHRQNKILKVITVRVEETTAVIGAVGENVLGRAGYHDGPQMFIALKLQNKTVESKRTSRRFFSNSE